MKKAEDIRVVGKLSIQSMSFDSNVPGESKEDLQFIDVKDFLEYDHATCDGFVLRLTRCVYGADKKERIASVVVEAEALFEDGAGKDILRTSESLKAWIDDNKIRLSDTFGMPSVASNAISSMMAIAGLVPLVTQPKTLL